MEMRGIESLLVTFEGFEWDEGNINKNWQEHKISSKEGEEVFFNKPLIINFDKKHSKKEKRFQVLGKTNKERKLFISFTLRNKKIRMISARDQSRKERRIYEKA